LPHSRHRTTVSFDLQVADANGNPYTITRSGSNPAPPKFVVRNAAGRKVWGGSFEYG